MERLVLTIPCERGELFYNISGRRILLANCTPNLEIYEHTKPLDTVSDVGLKSYHAALALCGKPEFTRSLNDDFLRQIQSFDLSTDIQRKNGTFEVFRFMNIKPQEMPLDGEWVFELNETQETLRKLLAL